MIKTTSAVQESVQEKDVVETGRKGRKPLVAEDTYAYSKLVDECRKLLEQTEQTIILSFWTNSYINGKISDS